ncbi:MAG: hypothetical protein ACPGO0_03310 [Acidimicrobiales bacterium]
MEGGDIHKEDSMASESQMKWPRWLIDLSALMQDLLVVTVACATSWLLALYQLHGLLDEGELETFYYLCKEIFPPVSGILAIAFVVRLIFPSDYKSWICRHDGSRIPLVNVMLRITLESVPFVALYFLYSTNVNFPTAAAPLFLGPLELLLCQFVIPGFASILVGVSRETQFFSDAHLPIKFKLALLGLSVFSFLLVTYLIGAKRIVSWPPSVFTASCVMIVVLRLFPGHVIEFIRGKTR